MKKKVILCPNPYRDSELKVAKDAKAILEGIGFETCHFTGMAMVMSWVCRCGSCSRRSNRPT